LQNSGTVILWEEEVQRCEQVCEVFRQTGMGDGETGTRERVDEGMRGLVL